MDYNPERICFRRLHDVVYDGMIHKLIPLGHTNTEVQRVWDFDRERAKTVAVVYFISSGKRFYCYEGSDHHIKVLNQFYELIGQTTSTYESMYDLNNARREALQLLSDKLRCSIRN